MTAFDIMDALNDVDEKLLDAALGEKTARSGRRYMKIVAAAVIAAALLIGAAIAASSDGFLSELFGESYDIIGDYVMMEPISVENEYARLTVESALFDGFNAYIVYSIERIDGGVMENMSPEIILTPIFSEAKRFVGSSRMGDFDTESETPEKQYFMWYVRSADVGIEAIELRFFGVDDRSDWKHTDLGEIKVTVPLEKCPVKQISGAVGEPMGEDVFSSIVLSPLGLRIEAWPNLTPLDTDGSGTTQRTMHTEPGHEILLLRKDGTEHEIEEQIQRSNHGARDYIACTFEKPIEIDDIKAIIVDGISYKLDYAEIDTTPLTKMQDSYLETNKQYIYGKHQPLYPRISAVGAETTLSLESIWTDGNQTELFFYIDTPKENWNAAMFNSYLENGLMEFKAIDKKGNDLAVGCYYVPTTLDEGERVIMGAKVYTGGKAKSLIISLDGAKLEIPLEMKKLKKLPQGEPEYEPTERREDSESLYQSVLNDIFGEETPVRVDISKDNGEYLITLEYVKHELNTRGGIIRGLVCCEKIGEGDYERLVPPRELTLSIVKDGEESQQLSTSGGFVGTWYDNNRRYSKLNIKYYDKAETDDTVRLTWTPPSGERIVLDIPIE